MDRRFSTKDFFFLVLLAAILISQWLGKVQVDRQWQKLESLEGKTTAQAEDISEIANGMERLIGSGGSIIATERDLPEAFDRLQEVTEMDGFARGDWLIQTVRSRIENLTPLISSSAYATRVQWWVQEPLIYRDPYDPERWIKLLAEDYSVEPETISVAIHEEPIFDSAGEPVLDESGQPAMRKREVIVAEGSAPIGAIEVEEREVPVVTFKLRKGVRFSDGEGLDADDVVFTYDFIMTPAIKAPRHRAYFGKIGRVEKVNQYEVRFVFIEPYFNALSLAGGMDIMPEHVYAQYLDDPQEFNQSTGILVGSGPYMMDTGVAWTPDSPIELVRNPRYWGLQPAFDKLVWKVIETDSTQVTAFRNQEIDIYQARPVEFEQLKADPQIQGIANNFRYMSPTAGYTYIAWNQRNQDGTPSRFADRRVRQALTYLTDRERACREVFLGYAQPANGPFHPMGQQDSPNVQGRTFDLERARELLSEAGYADRDGDAVIEHPDHGPFEFDLIYPSGSDDYEKVVFLLKDLYAMAGIALEPKRLDFNVMLTEHIDKKNFEAMTLGWTSNLEIDIFQMFHSSQTVPGGDNYMWFQHEEFDRLVDEARTEIDEAVRMPKWHRAHEILFEEQPYTFLFRRETTLFVHNRIRNVGRTEIGLNMGGRGGMPCEWFVPRSQQRYKD